MYSPLSDFSGPDSSPMHLDVEDELDLDAEDMLSQHSFQDDTETSPDASTTEQPVDQPEETSTATVPLPATPEFCYGYKLVGDNVDKNVKPSLQRFEKRGQSLHHFHSFGVRDRIPAASLPDIPPKTSAPDPAKFLPSAVDVECVKKEMSILLSRLS